MRIGWVCIIFYSVVVPSCLSYSASVMAMFLELTPTPFDPPYSHSTSVSLRQ
ncbi:hypothetical protein BJX68DRAFT_12216 [Aspergillus pseudodeflectus]|uniref:Uncharacterized protein n=1 Tax=Aspergillus pseudodeflectus TaxID=176178 RepID=A0ABR4LBA9_9EURO